MKKDTMPINSFKTPEEMGLSAKDFKPQNTSKIIIEDLKIYAYHGVLPEERLTGTYYLINVEIHTDLWKATETDNLDDTINYADINEIIHQEMEIPSQLLEHVIGRIFARLEMNFPLISFMKIKLTKTNPPMTGEMKGVSIELEKTIF